MPDLSTLAGNITIIGVGNMGGAILAGLIGAGFPSSRIFVVDPILAHQMAQKYGVMPLSDVAMATREASTIILAVKPGKVEDVVIQLAPQLSTSAMLISIAAGVTIYDIETWAATEQNPIPAVVRAIPNTPARLRQGLTAIAWGIGVTDAQVMSAQAVFGAIGAVLSVDESQMEAVSAVSGCGPAYLFLVAEAMIDGGVRLGLARETAARLVTQTFVGSAALLTTGETVSDLRAQVTSPGGTTAAAIFELEQRGVRAAFSAAMKASVDRSQELG